MEIKNDLIFGLLIGILTWILGFIIVGAAMQPQILGPPIRTAFYIPALIITGIVILSLGIGICYYAVKKY